MDLDMTYLGECPWVLKKVFFFVFVNSVWCSIHDSQILLLHKKYYAMYGSVPASNSKPGVLLPTMSLLLFCSRECKL